MHMKACRRKTVHCSSLKESQFLPALHNPYAYRLAIQPRSFTLSKTNKNEKRSKKSDLHTSLSLSVRSETKVQQKHEENASEDISFFF